MVASPRNFPRHGYAYEMCAVLDSFPLPTASRLLYPPPAGPRQTGAMVLKPARFERPLRAGRRFAQFAQVTILGPPTPALVNACCGPRQFGRSGTPQG